MADGVDLWAMPFGREIPWQLVDDFLALRLREHERLEYRERVDPRGERDRLVDAVAAMANSGGVGLILIGVKEDAATDRPQEGWLLKVGELRPQSLEQRCRVLDPYVPIEIAWAVKPDFGEVVLVRVPDFWDRPVFVPDRGILIRRGQSNGPAGPDQLRWWFATPAAGPAARGFDYSFSGYFTIGMATEPRVNLGVTATRPWMHSRWDDATDEVLEGAARRWYGDLLATTVADGLINFAPPGQTSEASDFLRSFPSGAVLRHREAFLCGPGGKAADVEVLAEELLRVWEFALAAIPTVLADYRGPLTMWFAVLGFSDGLHFPSRPRGLERYPLQATDSWTKTWSDVAQGARGDEVATAVLGGLARALGYRHASVAVREAVDAAIGRLPGREHQ